MNWLYLANARIPSEKAHVYQILQMVDALVAAGQDVRVIYPRRANLPGLRHLDPRAFYGLRHPCHLYAASTIDLVRLVTIDVPVLNRPPLPLLAHSVQEASFAISSALLVRRSASRPPGANLLYGRDWPVLLAATYAVPSVPAFWEAHDLPQRPAVRRAIRRLLTRVHGVVAITEGVRQELLTFGLPPERVLVAPDAVDLGRFAQQPSRDEARAGLGLPADRQTVVYAGHLYRWKGAHTLALASRDLPEGAAVYVVGGTPADLESFRRFVAAERLDRVHVVGHVPPAEVPRWLAAADALALPNSGSDAISARYTSPLKLFEYMAAARPIVSSDLPSLREVLTHDHNAYLVAPDDPAALAAGLRAVLADRDLAARLAAQACQDVQGRTWDARARQVLDFVAQLALTPSKLRTGL